MPRSPITTCEWIFDDAATGRLGFNAFAKVKCWSGSFTFEAALDQLEEVVKKNQQQRPIMIKVPADLGETMRFESVHEAIRFLKRGVEVQKFETAQAMRETKVVIKKHTNVGDHTEYELDVREGTRQWSIQRRYREFVDLDLVLKATSECKCPVLPPKGAFGLRHKFNIGDFNEQRMGGLERYLDGLVSQTSRVTDIPALASFLRVPCTPDGAIKEPCFQMVWGKIDPLATYGLPRPIFKLPKNILREGIVETDIGIVEVAFGESEDVNGVEVTVVFKAGCRPSHVEGLVYDLMRKPLGRPAGIETFTFVRGPGGKGFTSILFKGSYSGDQGYSCKVPLQMTESLDINEFDLEISESLDGCHVCHTLLWINVWNQLFSEKNCNPKMAFTTENQYPCTQGTRKTVDRKYGLPHGSSRPRYELKF